MRVAEVYEERTNTYIAARAAGAALTPGALGTGAFTHIGEDLMCCLEWDEYVLTCVTIDSGCVTCIVEKEE